MRYTVVWQPSAERELADIWLDSTDRSAIANAANQIEQELQQNPVGAGESRDGRRRVVIARPLTVSYTVYEDDYVVKVTKVRRHSSA